MAWLDFWIPFINRKNQNSWKCHKCNYKIVAEVPPQKCPRCGTENPAVYYCDPEKNTSCSKESCYLHGGPCRLTLKPEAAREDREHPEDFE